MHYQYDRARTYVCIYIAYKNTVLYIRYIECIILILRRPIQYYSCIYTYIYTVCTCAVGAYMRTCIYVYQEVWSGGLCIIILIIVIMQ